MRATIQELARRTRFAADRLSDRPLPGELDKVRGQIRQLQMAIDLEFTQRDVEEEQGEATKRPDCERVPERIRELAAEIEQAARAGRNRRRVTDRGISELVAVKLRHLADEAEQAEENGHDAD